MTNDMIRWARVSPGVGGTQTGGLLPINEQPTLLLPVQPKQKTMERHRPNRGRVKRTNRNPPLDSPPWDMLRALNIPIPAGLECLPLPMPVNWRVGRYADQWRRDVRAMWGTVCHLCKHEGARTADHLIPLSVWPNQPYAPELSRTAHGVEGCATCGIKCNSSRGNKALAIEIGQYKPPIEL